MRTHARARILTYKHTYTHTHSYVTCTALPADDDDVVGVMSRGNGLGHEIIHESSICMSHEQYMSATKCYMSRHAVCIYMSRTIHSRVYVTNDIYVMYFTIFVLHRLCRERYICHERHERCVSATDCVTNDIRIKHMSRTSRMIYVYHQLRYERYMSANSYITNDIWPAIYVTNNMSASPESRRRPFMSHELFI